MLDLKIYANVTFGLTPSLSPDHLPKFLLLPTIHFISQVLSISYYKRPQSIA